MPEGWDRKLWTKAGQPQGCSVRLCARGRDGWNTVPLTVHSRFDLIQTKKEGGSWMKKQVPSARGLSPRPVVDLQQLGNFLSSIDSRFPALIFDPQGGRLYHYTDHIGLIGIIRDHDLWLTHSRYSNDEEEMKHGMGVVQEVLAEELKAATTAESKARLKLLAGHFASDPRCRK
jgi:hypothetical protein